MVQLTSKKAFKSAVLVTALGASGIQAAAIPAGQGSTSAASLDVDAAVLRLPETLHQKTFSLPENGKRMWRGRLGRRGPWRNEPDSRVDTDLINLDLSSGPHNHHGSLINIETVPSVHTRSHEIDDLINVDLSNGPHAHHGSLINVETVQPRRHGEDIIVVDDHRHHGHDVEVHEHVHGKRRHDDYYFDDEYRGRHGYYRDHYSHGHHGHYHGDHVYFNKRHHGDDVVVIEDHHGHHGHHDHHDHDENVHSHIHAHGDNINIVEKRRHDDVIVIDEGRHHHHSDEIVHEHIHAKKHNRDTTSIKGGRHGATIVDTGRHGTTVIDGGRHGSTIVNGGRHGVTVLDKKDIIEVGHGGRHHHDKVVVIDGDHRHGHPVVVERTISDTSVSSGGEGGDVLINGDKKPSIHVDKRHSDRVTIVDGRHRWRDTDAYYRHEYGRPLYFDHGYGHGVRVVDGWYKRSHSDRDDHHDRHDRHDQHGHSDKHDKDVIMTKRDNAIDMGGAPGYIDVTSPVANSTNPARIASLVLSTTNGTETNSSFVLNASNNIRTQVYLVPAKAGVLNATDVTSPPQDGPIRVNLKLPIFVAQSASVEPYCATFDPAPTNPGPLFVTKCMAEGSDPHSSQVFSYDPASGVIHPDWKPSPVAQAVLASIPDSVDDDDTSVSATSDDVDASAVTSAAASASSSAPPALNTTGPKSSTDSTALDSKASNVTLVFTPVNPSVQTNLAYDDDDTEDAQSPFSTASEDSSQDDSDAPTNPQMDTRNWGYPGDYEEEPHRPSQYGAPMYDDYDEGYAPYGRDEYEDRPRYTAPYDWRWTKTGDDTVASAPAATFA